MTDEIQINNVRLTDEALKVLTELQNKQPGNLCEYYQRALQELIELIVISDDMEAEMDHVRCLTMIKQDLQALHGCSCDDNNDDDKQD